MKFSCPREIIEHEGCVVALQLTWGDLSWLRYANFADPMGVTSSQLDGVSSISERLS